MHAPLVACFSAALTQNGVDDLGLFAVLFDQMADGDEPLVAGVGALKAGVMRLYCAVIVAVTLEMIGSVTTMMTVLTTVTTMPTVAMTVVTTMTSMTPVVVTETTPAVGTPGVPTTVETTSTTSLTFRDPPPTPHYSQIDS